MKIELIPFVLEHHTLCEGGKTKTHILNTDNEKVLCGVRPSSTSGGTPFVITKEWLNQPDPDKQLCLKCKKFAAKFFA